MISQWQWRREINCGIVNVRIVAWCKMARVHIEMFFINNVSPLLIEKGKSRAIYLTCLNFQEDTERIKLKKEAFHTQLKRILKIVTPQIENCT